METHQFWMLPNLNYIKSFLKTNAALIEKEVRNTHRKPKPVVATELNTPEGSRTMSETDNVKEYESMYGAYKALRVNPGQIKMCCEGTNNVKTAYSKKNGKRY